MNQENYLVENPISQPIDPQYLQQDERPAIEASQPSINPQPYEPGTLQAPTAYGEAAQAEADVVEYVPTQLINGERTGVVRQEDLSFEQWEQQVLRQQHQNFVNRTSIHMQPPQSSGAPYINEQKHNKKNSSEQLKQLKREQDIADIQQRLTLLKQAETKLRKDLDKNKQVQAVLHQRLEGLMSKDVV